MKRIERIGASLEGSPYSLPTGDEASERIINLMDRSDAFEARCTAVRQTIAKELARNMSHASRTSEIYESNKIEGKTATLAETYEIMTSRQLFDADAAIAAYTFTQALNGEPRVNDVVGLAAARILVDQFARDRAYPLTETSVRELHAMVLVGTRSAGRYKQYINQIEGSSHTPIAPADVPAAMGSLVDWFHNSPAPLLWKSVVVHAWLTHIHPFDDGNGRMARLLANYTLGFGAYPPLIIKASSDRGRYIDALGLSDHAGDIVPLARVFIRAINRQLTIMERPDFVWTLFQKDLRIREQSLYTRWATTASAFVREAEGHLLHSAAYIDRVGDLSPSDFELLRERDRSGNAWFGRARRRGGRDLLLWFGHPSNALARRLESDQIFPSLFFSERDPAPKPSKPYLSRVLGRPELHDELCIIADEGRAILRRGDKMENLRIPQAAELWASLIVNYLDEMDRNDHGAFEIDPSW